jgi:hypothetical protein
MDIYGRQGNDYKGSFAADAARVVFGGNNNVTGVGLLTQQISVNYVQNITRLYEIGTQFTYLVAGRTQGNIQLGRVLGPRAIQVGFYTKFGNVCNAATNNLNFEVDAGCNSQGEFQGMRFSIKNAVITSIAVTVEAMNMLINETLTMMFVSLDLNGAAAAGNIAGGAGAGA